MNLNNEKLAKTLDILSPALNTHGLIPIFGNYCFNKNGISTYNDEIGIFVPFSTNIEGGIGPELNTWVKNCNHEINLDVSNDCILLTSGGSKIKLPLTDKSCFIHSIPANDRKDPIILTSEFISALKTPMISVSSSSSLAALKNITMCIKDDIAMFYSSNGVSICNTLVSLSNVSDGNFILNKSFCEALLYIQGALDEKCGKLFVGENYLYAQIGDVIIWANPINYDEFKLDFLSEINTVLVGHSDDNMILSNDTLIDSIKNIINICGKYLEENPCKINIENGIIKIEFNGKINTSEEILIDNKKVVGKYVLDIKYLLEGLEIGKEIEFLQNAVSITNTDNGNLYLLAYRK